MISEKDFKALNGVSDKKYKIIQVVFIIFALFELFIAYNNLSLSISFGHAMGLNLEEILSMWNTEPELQKQYIGYEVQSLYRLNMAILSLGVVVLFIISLVSMSANRKRNKRVLTALENCGAVQKNA